MKNIIKIIWEYVDFYKDAPGNRMSTVPVLESLAQLESLLQSAQAIAKRNGEGTHWVRFSKQLEEAGIHGITAKTFRVLPHDAETGDDGRHK